VNHSLLVRSIGLVACLVFVVGLFVGGAQPVAVGLFPEPWDKLAHVIAFGTLAALFEVTLRPRWWIFFALPLAVSAADEFHQVFLPGRSASVEDWVAGAVGVGIVWGLLRHTRLRHWVTILRG
jgi:VanZ family protein